MQVMLVNKFKCNLGKLVLLSPRYAFLGATKILRFPCPDLNKREHIMIFCKNVHFTKTTAVVPMYYSITPAFLQEGGCEIYPLFA